MRRDVSWQRIAFALLIGIAVFVGAKFAYGFQISLQDVIGIVIALAVVFGLAALILAFSDKMTLKGNMSAEERKTVVGKRSKRLHRGWAIAFLIVAIIALPIHAFGLEREPLWQRLVYVGVAAFIVIKLY